MKKNKINLLDRLYFFSLIFVVPFMIEITPIFGIFITSLMGISYAVISAYIVRKIIKNYDLAD